MNHDELEQQVSDVLADQAAGLDGRPRPAGHQALLDSIGDEARRQGWLSLGPARGSRRHTATPRVIAVAAAAAVAAGLAIGAERPDRVTIESPAADADQRTDQRTDRLLPPSDRWVAVAHSSLETEVAAEAPSSRQSAAFAVDGGLVLLSVSDSGTERVPLEQADPVEATNTTALAWDVNGEHVRLTGIDVPGAELVDLARSLTRTSDGWTLPAADLIHNETLIPAETEVEQAEFAAVGPDGDIDLAATISYSSARDTLGSMYLELGETVSLGSTRSATIGDGAGFVITGLQGQHAITFQDGYVSSWQTMGTDIDLAAFVASLEPVTTRQWAAAMDDADQVRQDTIDRARQEAVAAAAAGAENGPADGATPLAVPRYVLPAPWQPVRAFDDSLWSDEERAYFRAGRGPTTGWSEPFESIWHQTLRREGAGDRSVPDLLIQVERATGPRPALPTELKPVAFSGFQGGVFDNEGTAELRARNGDITLSVTAPSMTADELSTTVASLPLRSPSGEDGFDLADSPFTAGVDGPRPVAEPADPTGPSHSWRATWELDGLQVRLDLRPTSDHVREIELVYQATSMDVSVLATAKGEVVLGEREGTIIDPATGQPGVSRIAWWRPAGTDTEVMVVGDGGIDPLAIIDEVQAVSDEQWAEIIGPVALPFDDEPS